MHARFCLSLPRVLLGSGDSRGVPTPCCPENIRAQLHASWEEALKSRRSSNCSVQTGERGGGDRTRVDPGEMQSEFVNLGEAEILAYELPNEIAGRWTALGVIATQVWESLGQGAGPFVPLSHPADVFKAATSSLNVSIRRTVNTY